VSNTITVQFGGSVDINLHLAPPKPEPQILTIIKTTYQSFVCASIGDHMAYTLPVGQLINVEVEYVDSGGNAARVDGEIEWTTSNDQIAQLVVDEQDSSMCRILAVNDTGDVQVTATADADMGDGIREIITLLDLTVVAGEAIAGTINVTGTPEPIAEHPEQQK
jgi:hypothetical protein